jgi:large subunit ribosomal protein L35
MPKQKTHKGLRKRIKITARGKVLRTQAGKSHLMTGTPGRKVRSKRRRILAGTRDTKLLFKALRQG